MAYIAGKPPESEGYLYTEMYNKYVLGLGYVEMYHSGCLHVQCRTCIHSDLFRTCPICSSDIPRRATYEYVHSYEYMCSCRTAIITCTDDNGAPFIIAYVVPNMDITQDADDTI